MVTLYNLQDLIDFGYYLLSEERTELVKNNPSFEGEGEDNLKDRLAQVYHADVKNWHHLRELQMQQENPQTLEQEEESNE